MGEPPPFGPGTAGAPDVGQGVLDRKRVAALALSRCCSAANGHAREHDNGVCQSFPVDLRAWIESEHAAGQGRFEQQVAARVPRERWTEQAGGDGSSIAWLRFHTAWHEDLAVQCAVSGRAPVLTSWRSALGIDDADPSDGL